MSPGATFERVYNELKRMLAEGELPPGTPIEPAQIGKEIAASITPIRDALHRLTGERLVEAPNHNGFRVPMPTEAGLRDLYNWSAHILALAARYVYRSPTSLELSRTAFEDDPVTATADLFVEIARATGSAEHSGAVRQLNDRLAPIRIIELRLFENAAPEHHAILQAFRQAERKTLATRLADYHRLRTRYVVAIVAHMRAEGR